MSNIYSVWFQQLNLSEYVKKQLLLMIGDYKKIFDSNYDTYLEWGLSPKASTILIKHKINIESCSKIIDRCNIEGIKIIDFYHKQYPWLLREIPDSPIILYVKGNENLLSEPMIAIVGARHCSEYGQQYAMHFGKKLAEYGVCVVSGMALGIDGAAHIGALQTGTTIGILGTGVNICYPSSNHKIYREILQKGCLVSEYPPDTLARPYHFPKRNRIISGMSYGIVVIEAAIKSGSLITAQLAMDYAREVYALPGNINSRLSEGTNALIRTGAICITSVEDIIEEMPDGLCIKNKMTHKNRNKLDNELAKAEMLVYANVSQEPIMFQKILERTQLSYERINTSLLQLEVKGLIQRLPGERYVRI